MELFYTITLTIAILLLIIILAYLGLKIRGSALTQNYPPQTSSCPDGWTSNGIGGNCIIPNITPTPYNFNSSDTFGLGVNTVDFSNSGWYHNNTSSICNKNAWAGKYGITWDGITNYNGC